MRSGRGTRRMYCWQQYRLRLALQAGLKNAKLLQAQLMKPKQMQVRLHGCTLSSHNRHNMRNISY